VRPACSSQLRRARALLTVAAQAAVGTFKLRYFVCGLEQWQATPGPLFFYTGNVRSRNCRAPHSPRR
jgi:hypothetical protein